MRTWNMATATILAGGLLLGFSSSAGLAQDTGSAPPADASTAAPSTTAPSTTAPSTTAPSTTASSTAATTPASATDATTSDTSAGTSEGAAGDYNRELRTVEEQVSGLKERVFRSKATLELLKEVVIQGASSGSNATIWHINKLGSAYVLESISYFVDGQNRFSKSDPKGSLDDSKEFKVYEGAIPPGEHNLAVDVRLRGNGYGIFKYVEKYEVNFKANSTFTAEEGKTCQVQVVLQKQKGIGKSFTERPNVAFQTRCTRQEGGSAAQ